jgi:membrane protease YdiL (CAAX protease family)
MQALFRRTLRVIWAGLLGLLITFAGSIVWGVLLTVNLRTSAAIPWSVIPETGFLWLLWKYLGGNGWPHRTSESRRRSRRANPVSGSALAWSLLAGVLAIAALAGYWIALSQLQLVKMRPDIFFDYSRYPLLTVALVIVMGSLNSPITEEAGFRGYCQTSLEREFRAPVAVALASFFFMLAHLSQGLYWPKLLVFYLAGVTFGTIAYLANSILASIPVHILGDLTFFIFIWPRDAARKLVWDGGADAWFWVHVAQAIVFTGLAILAFRRLAQASRGARSLGGSSALGFSQING